MPIQRKNLFLTWGIRISLVPVILVLLALGLIAIVLFAICGVCGRFLAALGGLAALLALFDKCYQEAAVSAILEKKGHHPFDYERRAENNFAAFMKNVQEINNIELDDDESDT